MKRTCMLRKLLLVPTVEPTVLSLKLVPYDPFAWTFLLGATNPIEWLKIFLFEQGLFYIFKKIIIILKKQHKVLYTDTCDVIIYELLFDSSPNSLNCAGT